ncbi:PBP1A family penicillin-binding protein [Rhabdaerophilum sp. SD176]|uniref:transglycosylase domain-containing protein n=1 Tax=Rhabdaerophilum sp. SD176 TaxID=2983548 RepID=UPI0024DF89D8|nr:PBP1A family penicillin-binding protein [Rhabdaerophilum sp. SD176]
MTEFRTLSTWEKLARRLRDADAWLEDALHRLGERVKEGLWRIRHASDRLEPSPGGRVAVTVACEALTYCLIGGIFMTALAKPAFRAVNEDDWLKQQDLAVTFVDQTGAVIGKRGILHSEAIAIEDLPEHLVKAALATEDRRFYEHWGIDPQGLFRAVVANARANGVVQGGSTITQQLAKNLFLNNERSLERKIKEAFLALWLESRLSKREILKLYLDRAYLGNGVFGVQSAAEHYFGKDVRDLTLAEAAMIAGLFKAPSKFSPNVNLPAARARAADVLSNMVEAGFLTQGQVSTALRNPATPVERANQNIADYALDFGFEEIKQLAAAGKLGNHRTLIVRATIDPGLQKHVERASESILRQHGPNYQVKQAALVMLDHTGGLRAMVGGRDYGQSQFNRAVQAMRQPGSSFKPFVYAAALHDGVIKPDSIVVDRPTCVNIGRPWCPQNYGRSYAGSMPAIVALAKSINTIPIQLNEKLGKGNHKAGRARVHDVLRKVGFSNEVRDIPGMPLGVSEVTVVDMATGFNAFANGGRLAKPYVAREIATPAGEVIYRAEQDLEKRPQVIPAYVALDMNRMLRQVVTAGTGRRATLPGVPTAGKTGTTDEYRNAWFVGYSGNFTTAVWFGNDDYTATNNMTGGSLPAMLFQQAMAFAHLDIDAQNIVGLGDEDKPVRDPKLAELAGALEANLPQAGRLYRLSPRGKSVLREIEAAGEDKPAGPVSGLGTMPAPRS